MALEKRRATQGASSERETDSLRGGEGRRQGEDDWTRRHLFCFCLLCYRQTGGVGVLRYISVLGACCWLLLLEDLGIEQGGYHCTDGIGDTWMGWDGVGWELFRGVLLVELNRQKWLRCVLAYLLSRWTIARICSLSRASPAKFMASPFLRVMMGDKSLVQLTCP